MKGSSLAVAVVGIVGGFLLVGTAMGITFNKIFSPFTSTNYQSSDIDFIRKIDKNARKVCADEELERIPTEDGSYLTYEFRKLEEGRLSERGGTVVLDYGKNERRIPLSDECESYSMQTFESGVKKFWIEEDGNGATIGVKSESK